MHPLMEIRVPEFVVEEVEVSFEQLWKRYGKELPFRIEARTKQRERGKDDDGK